jgi:uncharacterized protein
MPELPSAFEGYVVAIVADLHTGIPRSFAQSRRALRAAAEAEPDLLVLLGDYGHSYKRSRAVSRPGYRRSMRLLTPLLETLQTRDGVIGLLGNHDYYFDGPAVRRWLESLGVRVLVNEHYVVERNGARVAFVGVDDEKEGHIDLERAVAGLPDDAPRILLSHNPDGTFLVEPRFQIATVLSGHTHGGQIVLPWYGAPLRFCRICGRHEARGWVTNRFAPLYVTSGVGGMVPFRINAPPEIVLARLRRASDQQLV